MAALWKYCPRPFELALRSVDPDGHKPGNQSSAKVSPSLQLRHDIRANSSCKDSTSMHTSIGLID